MTDLSEEEEELLRRAEQAARDPYREAKQEVLHYIEGLPVQFTDTGHLLEHLEAKKGLRQGEIAGVLLEMRCEGLIEFQATGGSILVYISETGIE